MKRSLLRLSLLLVFILPLPAQAVAQEFERAEPAGARFSPPPAGAVGGATELRERHYTPFLLESEEGRETLQQFHLLKDQGYYESRIRLFDVEIGDRREFFVRNLEQDMAGNTVFEEIEFELVRRSGSLDIGGAVEIWVEVDELAPDRVTEELLDEIFEGMVDRTPSNSIDPQRGVVEIGRELFGEQPAVDGSGVLKLLIANIQDGWDGEAGGFFTAGFFDPVHLLPASQNEHSNEADIIYLNSMPGLYREDVGVRGPRLNTIAHELQHLIHANYDRLSTFQNEGQSELAEILSGFSARPMNFLNSGSELRGDIDGTQRWIYRFRRQSSDVVLFDYQRAQLLHSYLEELVGPDDAGSLTRVERSHDAAYLEVLDRHEISLDEFFTGFYLTAYANRNLAGGPSGFSRSQLANVRVANPGVFFGADDTPWVLGREERLYYGGVLYTQWFGVEDLELTIESGEGITQRALYRKRGEEMFTMVNLQGGEISLDGEGEIFEEVVLVSINHTPLGSSATSGESRTFRYSGTWTPTDLVSEELSYHGEPAARSPLPWQSVMGYALRITPDFNSAVRMVRFTLVEEEGAIQGEGELLVALREAVPEQNAPVLIPGSVIASQPVMLNDISAGENFIGVNSEEWSVEQGEEYFITLEVVEDRGGLFVDLLFDSGTTGAVDPPDPNYIPVRTLAGVAENGEFTGWHSLQFTDSQTGEIRQNLNILMAAHLVGLKETGRPEFPEPPASDSYELLANYPNPFHGQTTIAFSLPEEAEIEIAIHDILGRRVDLLHTGPMPAGLHRMSFDASGLASGIYFYRLRYPGGALSRRMTLLR